MQSARVVLEACPPLVKHSEKAFALLEHVFRCYSRFDVVSVPDIQDGAEFGRNLERVRNLQFVEWLRGHSDRPVSLYKVSVTSSQQDLTRWLEQAHALRCRDIIVVGGDSSHKTYGGLDLETASLLARQKGFHCGGIIIPTRRHEFVHRPATLDELDRLVRKIKHWPLTFFTTQILYESEWMSCLLLDLVRKLSHDSFPKIFLTFSPFACEADLEFAKKALGVYVPPDVERLLRGARNMAEESIGIVLNVWERISTFANEIGIPLDRLGVNVEYLNSRNPRNVRAAFELAEEFGRLMGVA